MIQVATQGRSFRGCLAYHAHDKRRAGESQRLTTARVAWTHTRNLPTDDVDKAWRIMAYTAGHQKEIKAAAGRSLSGPACDKPVYSLVLAWAPEQVPSRDEMLRAADGALKTLRMHDRQAVIVCHNDEPQPHIHVIVNRVCHLSGQAAAIRRDWLKLSVWAERYERETGQVLCELRVNHNARRARGEYVRNDNLTRREYDIVRHYMTMPPDDIRAQRQARQEIDRDRLRERIAARRGAFATERQLQAEARSRLVGQLAALEARRRIKGLFAAAVRFTRRLTGSTARQERQIKALHTAVAGHDARTREQRAQYDVEVAREIERLANRHRAEIARDERLIAHARGRGERERMGRKARMNFKVRTDAEQRFVPKAEDKARLRIDLARAARDTGPGMLDRLIQQMGGPANAQSRRRSLADDALAEDGPAEPSSERRKRWTRAEGRGANRTPGRKRRR